MSHPEAPPHASAILEPAAALSGSTEVSRRPHAPWTLQNKLIVTVISIVSLILVTVAVAMSVILGGVLEGRLGEQVRANVDSIKSSISQQVSLDPSIDATELLERMQPAPGFLLAIETANGVSAAAMTDRGVVALSDDQLADFIEGVSSDAARERATRTVSIKDLGNFQIGGAASPNAITVVGLSRADIADTIAEMLTVIGMLTTGGLLLLVAATTWVIRIGLAPLRAVADTAERVAQQPLDQGAVTIAERVPSAQADPRTEVGRVGEALNTLLDHVDASLDARQRNEDRMRRFVADASHELRTPLASIRGYSELSLRDRTLSEISEQSLQRIQAQSLRMTGIVEDLLLLARLDEGQELVYGTSDLSRLVVEAVGDAQVAAPDHAWSIEVDDEPVLIAGDTARLHQVVANLLANARTHTPAGTHVTASVVREGSDAVVRVHDDGPGIDPALQAELFERFSRGDTSRARQTGGSGLGLSIVRAIVEAHDGTISMRSEPGDTEFEVRLPAKPRDPEA
jgi:two-component system OmpR family sensor kinase